MAGLVVAGLAESDGIVFKVAPAGVYEARIVSSELKETSAQSKHPGKPQLQITAKLMSDEFSQVQVKGYYSIPHDEMDAEEKRMNTAKLKRLWIACGLDAGADALDTDDLLHCNLKVQVGVEKYNGQDVNRLGDVLPM